MSSGRGRLSSIEILGEDYEDIVTWAAGELRDRVQFAQDICVEFNRRLRARAEEIGDDLARFPREGVRREDFPISKSAFSRYSVRMARLARQLNESNAIARVLNERLPPGQTDKNTIALAELIKSLMQRKVEDGAVVTPLDIKLFADALKSVSAAEAASSARRGKLEKEAADASAKAAAAALSEAADSVEKVAREAGMPADRIAQLRREFLGIRDRPPAGNGDPA